MQVHSNPNPGRVTQQVTSGRPDLAWTEQPHQYKVAKWYETVANNQLIM